MSASSSIGYIPKRAPRKQTFTVLVCGASGTGKSSFINTFVGKKMLFDSDMQSAPRPDESLHFQPTTVELDGQLSDGARLVLTMIETEGFGQALNHEMDVASVAHLIEHRFDEVLAEESRIRRNPRFKDNRIDVCLYFIEPTGHGLREIDVLTLKRLGSIVNVIPVLARADSLTPAEVALNKRLIAEDIQFYDIELFSFQFSDESGNTGPEVVAESELYAAVPFAVTSSSEFSEGGQSLFVRKLSYGSVQILDPKQSDFKMLRDALIDEYLIELKDRTHDVLYETFRTQRLDPKAQHRTSILMPQQLADHAARLKQAQIDRETNLLREQERRVNAEIEAKRALLAKRELELRQLDLKMAESRLSSRSASQPSSAQSSRFPADQIPGADPEVVAGSRPTSIPAHEQSEYNTAPLGPSEFAGSEGLDSVPPVPQVHVAGEIPSSSGKVTEDAAVIEQRIRYTRSKKDLREHANQLHLELGNLEAQREDIQRQVASATSFKSVADQISASASQSNTRISSDSFKAELETTDLQLNTSPLNIKKTAQA